MRYQIFKSILPIKNQNPKYVVIDTYEDRLIINCNDRSSAEMYIEDLNRINESMTRPNPVGLHEI